MGPPRSGQVLGVSAGTGSIAGSSTPSSHPSPSCAADECLTKKPRVGVQRSWIWAHFDIMENGDRAECKHCRKGKDNYKIGGKSHGTANLQHLDKCNDYKNTLKKEAGHLTLHQLLWTLIL